MKNLFTVNFAENAIVASKTTLKKAGDSRSPEYKELMKLIKKHPTFAVVEKEINSNKEKNSYKGLNGAFIQQYISIQSNADVLTKQYEKVCGMGSFPLVRKWFLSTFQNFDMTSAKAEIAESLLEKVYAISADQQNTAKIA